MRLFTQRLNWCRVPVFQPLIWKWYFQNLVPPSYLVPLHSVPLSTSKRSLSFYHFCVSYLSTPYFSYSYLSTAKGVRHSSLASTQYSNNVFMSILAFLYLPWSVIKEKPPVSCPNGACCYNQPYWAISPLDPILSWRSYCSLTESFWPSSVFGFLSSIELCFSERFLG